MGIAALSKETSFLAPKWFPELSKYYCLQTLHGWREQLGEERECSVDPGRNVCGWALCCIPFQLGDSPQGLGSGRHWTEWRVPPTGLCTCPLALLCGSRITMWTSSCKFQGNLARVVGWWATCCSLEVPSGSFPGGWVVDCWHLFSHPASGYEVCIRNAWKCVLVWVCGAWRCLEGSSDSVMGGELRRSRGRNCSVSGTESLVLREWLLTVLQIALHGAVMNSVTHWGTEMCPVHGKTSGVSQVTWTCSLNYEHIRNGRKIMPSSNQIDQHKVILN